MDWIDMHKKLLIAQKHTGNAMITTHWSSCLCLKTKAGIELFTKRQRHVHILLCILRITIDYYRLA